MSVRLWSYESEKCDGDYCPNDCDRCSKAKDGEHIPLWQALTWAIKEREKNDNKCER